MCGDVVEMLVDILIKLTLFQISYDRLCFHLTIFNYYCVPASIYII